MFDLGFSELVVIVVLGLIILGPKRMPVAIRFIAKFLAKLRAMMNGIQQEINRELELDELKKSMEQTKNEVKATADQVQHAAKLDLTSEVSELKETVKTVKKVADGK